MEPAEFKESKPGRLMRAREGYWTFVLAPLPPTLELSWDLVAQLSEADRALAELAGLGRNLPNPHLLIRPFVRREAVLSSRIEGTQASLTDLFLFEAVESGPPPAQGPADVKEVVNYIRALEHGLERLKELPLSLRLIREIHAKLMEGARGEHMTPGEFRRSQNWIGPPGCALADATFVPPPVPEMMEALGAFEKFLHAPTRLPPLVRLAQVHYQFEAIHPFLDGNGRVGRLLISLMLCHEGLLPQPLLYLSAFFERRRQDYYRLLLEISRSGAWMEWIRFFLQGIADQSRDAVGRSARLIDLRHAYRRRLEAARSSALLLRLVDDLFEHPVITIQQAARRLGITHRAAGLNIDKLVAAGILREVTGRKRYRLYAAREIIRTVEEPTA